tara:strand:+ start:282 stop:497 length:216 start_codon:yes stop_codon:yes gene_type:complete
MFFALSFMSSFVVLGLFIYKREFFHNSKDSLSLSDNHSEEIENYFEESFSDFRIFKNNQSLEVNLEIHDSI